MANRVPRTRCGGLWTESQHWGYIRSALRRAWLRYPERAIALKEAREPYKGTDKRIKWTYYCGICGEGYKAKDVQVDHVLACGSLKSYSDISGFAERLFCEAYKLRILCKPCHKQVTKEQRDAKTNS